MSNYEDRAANVLCIATPENGSKVLYKKIHPFSYVNEDKLYASGNELGIINLKNISIGLTICYDLRFPELYSAMAKKVDAIIVIANWPKSRISHWKTLLKARSIENQCYMVGVNRIGKDGNGVEYEKSSMVISPKGEIIPPRLTTSEIDVCNIDSNLVSKTRDEFPTLKDKRKSLYQDLLFS